MRVDIVLINGPECYAKASLIKRFVNEIEVLNKTRFNIEDNPWGSVVQLFDDRSLFEIEEKVEAIAKRFRIGGFNRLTIVFPNATLESEFETFPDALRVQFIANEQLSFFEEVSDSDLGKFKDKFDLTLDSKKFPLKCLTEDLAFRLILGSWMSHRRH